MLQGTSSFRYPWNSADRGAKGLTSYIPSYPIMAAQGYTTWSLSTNM